MSVTKEKFKIVFLIGSFNFGGAEKHALSLANFYANILKWETEVWAWHKRSGRVIEICDGLNIKTRLVPKFFKFSKFFYKRQVESYAKVCRDQKVDIVMSFNNIPNVVATAFKEKAKLKAHIWAQQGIDITAKIFQSKREKEILKTVSCVISNSYNGKKYLMEEHGIPEGIISVVQNGINEPESVTPKEEWSKRLGLTEQDFTGLMIANMTYMKDHATLIRAWKRLCDATKDSGVNPILLFAGRFDTATDECLELIRELGLVKNVVLLGPIKDINGLANTVDLAILSSPTEGVPNAVLESMILGKPFVGTDIPGIREAVGEGNYKFLSPLKDDEALFMNIKQFVDNPELKAEVGAKNKEWVLERFRMETLYEQTHEILLEQLAKNEKR